VIDVLFARAMRENLLIAPLMVVVEITEIMITMGADDFTDFVTSYFVEFLIMCIERLYIDPACKRIMNRIPKWKMQIKRRFTTRRRLTKAARKEMDERWQQILDDIKAEEEGVEPLLDSYLVYALETTSMFMTPFVNIFLIAFSHETQIPELYGIKPTHMLYYLLFAIVLIPFQLVCDMFLLNTAELQQGWKLYDYIHYQKYRFTVREVRWQMKQSVVDESIKQPFQTLDMMCFSSQFYFITTLHAWGMLMACFGITCHMRYQFNLFGDPMVIFIACIVWYIADITKYLLVLLGRLCRVWRLRVTEGTVDDELAKRLAVGEDNKDELEQARLELQAMNSERFRHRFLERSRPWILQHLEDLLTPRTLQMPGPDNKPNIDYIREVYMELIGMGLGQRKGGDRADISSDSDADDLEHMRRNWTNTPVDGAAKEIIVTWLKKARRRRTCMKLVLGYLRRMTKDACEQCGRTEASGNKMIVSMVDPKTNECSDLVMNQLIDDFVKLSPLFDASAWKAYFRKNAMLRTRCNHCVDKVEAARVAERNAKLRTGPERLARAVDISDDEEDDAPIFDAIVVPRSSVEGRLLQKWLTASRKRLGGEFPRPEARVMMEQYKQRMRDQKIKKALQAKSHGLDAMPKEREGFIKKELELSAASKAIAQLWLLKARHGLVQNRRERAVEITKELQRSLSRMPEKQDFFYTKELRLSGVELFERGNDLTKLRKQMETSAQVRIQKLRDDMESFEKGNRATIVRLRRAQEAIQKRENEAMKAKIKARTAELEHEMEQQEMDLVRQSATASESTKKSLREGFEKRKNALEQGIEREQKKLQRELNEKHEQKFKEIDEKSEGVEQNILRRRSETETKILAINKEVNDSIEEKEATWRKKSLVWLNKARRKFEAKKRADEEMIAAKKRRM